jgi:hypothetical protein
MSTPVEARRVRGVPRRVRAPHLSLAGWHARGAIGAPCTLYRIVAVASVSPLPCTGVVEGATG